MLFNEYGFVGGEGQHRVAQFVPMQVHLYGQFYYFIHSFINRVKCKIKERENGHRTVPNTGCAEQVLESTPDDEWSAAVHGSAAASVARTDSAAASHPVPGLPDTTWQYFQETSKPFQEKLSRLTTASHLLLKFPKN